VQELLDSFVQVVASSVAAKKNRNVTDVQGLDGLPDGSLLLDVASAIVQLQLLPHLALSEVGCFNDSRVDRVPLLLLSAAAALEDAEGQESKATTSGLMQLLRSLGIYDMSLLTMLEGKHCTYEAASLARTYNRLGVIDEETAMNLERVGTTTILKCLSVAMDSSYAVTDTLSSKELSTSRLSSSSAGKWTAVKQLNALQSITEALQIPAELTQTYKDADAGAKVTKFLACAQPLISIAITITKYHEWTPQEAWERGDLVENLTLSLAPFASNIIPRDATSLAAEGLSNLAISATNHLSDALQTKINARASGGEKKMLIGLQALALKLLPTALPRLKQVLKTGSRSATDDNLARVTGETDNLACAIVAAHQMVYCLKQVQYPNLGSHSELVIPTVLIALDHYSPLVKRQAMMAFIHLADNLSPTELRWYKDAILDAVTRSVIGCEDLWPVVVQMSVALVTRIEGKNSHSQWYPVVMKEMLDELERHRDDEARRTVWMQLITPQLEAMGIVLVAHFKVLLPLLFHWLHANDDTTCLLVLAKLHTIVIHTWPRIPFHAKRIYEELVHVRNEAESRKSGPQIREAVDEVHHLLQLLAPSEKSVCS